MKSRVLIIAVFLGVSFSPLRAATITVSSTADSGADSLREALASAADGDTIDASGITGTILLTSGELLVTNSMDVVGPGPDNLAVNGNFPQTTNRVFRIGSGINVVIANMTITNGFAFSGQFPDRGGGILNEYSTLTVSNCTISGNFASEGGGIYNKAYQNRATLTVIVSTLSGNSVRSDGGGGGGVCSDGYEGNATLTVVASTFRENLAGWGGGICNYGLAGSATSTVITSTFSGNLADYGGGGIYNHTCYSDVAALNVVACTFSGNTASEGGGILNDAYYCPLRPGKSASRAGSTSGATLKIGGTILNAGATGANIANLAGTVTSDGYNLSSDDGGGLLTATGDQTNTNPILGPLQNNGGPTKTHALTAGSPAIDKGKNLSTSTTDQRGQPRTFDDPDIANAGGGDGTDIGAYEISELHMTAVDKLGNDLRLSFTSVLGTNYEVQSRPDLTSGTWGSLPGSTPGNGGIAQTTVTNALSDTQQFYRVHLLP